MTPKQLNLIDKATLVIGVKYFPDSVSFDEYEQFTINVEADEITRHDCATEGQVFRKLSEVTQFTDYANVKTGNNVIKNLAADIMESYESEYFEDWIARDYKVYCTLTRDGADLGKSSFKPSSML